MPPKLALGCQNFRFKYTIFSTGACIRINIYIYIVYKVFHKLCPIFIVMSLTVMILSFQTHRPGQTVQTQIRLLLEEQSDLGLHCLQFPLHPLDALL